MRLLTLFLLLAVFIAAPTAEGDIGFSLLGATSATYKQFIKQFRAALTVNSQKVYGIPVLPATASGSKRFILINLTNYNGESIAVAIDVVNVYVVAYKTGNKSYFFKDIPAEAHKVLFKGTTPKTLGYKGNYDSLPSREKVELGFSEFSSAIGNLFHYKAESLPKSFVVIIQSISEAARFYYIEQRVSQNVSTKFKPDPGFLSLENRWSDLSEQVLKAQKNGGKFKRNIEVRSVSNKPILVTNVSSPVVKGMALLLYYKVSSAADHNGHSSF